MAVWHGQGTPVLLIHPNRTSHRVWDFMLAALQCPMPFFAPALRGHAQSDWPQAGYTLEDHRDDLLALIEAQGWKEMVIVGQATGAALALMLATQLQKRVLALVLAQPAVAIGSHVNDLVQQQVRATPQFENRDQARMALPFCERWSDQVTEHYLDHILRPHPQGGWQWNFHAEGVCETEARHLAKCSLCGPSAGVWRCPINGSAGRDVRACGAPFAPVDVRHPGPCQSPTVSGQPDWICPTAGWFFALVHHTNQVGVITRRTVCWLRRFSLVPWVAEGAHGDLQAAIINRV
jgi:pimeloyl-ACP methyl ester carboxylesterase